MNRNIPSFESAKALLIRLQDFAIDKITTHASGANPQQMPVSAALSVQSSGEVSLSLRVHQTAEGPS